MRGLVIAAPASAQGKTTVTLGLLRALRRAGVDIASGKSGPDYIDPAFHAAATGRPCVTLDAWAGQASQMRARAASASADMLVVEGAMGAFDGALGAGPSGQGSSAALAAALGVPMILVVDVAHMGQSVGALIAGCAAWAKAEGTSVAGVILNRIGSARHLAMTRDAVAATCPVLGGLPRDLELVLPSRHLGLVQAAEHADLEGMIDRAADWVADHVGLDALMALALPVGQGVLAPIPPLGQRIAVAADRAFGFAYWHMLEDWRAAGAEVVPFSPLADEEPCETCDAVFLPGGYPELHAGPLSQAVRFRTAMQAAAARGVLIYGECGGYMVLGDAVTDASGETHPMLGLLPVETSFAERRRHLGYRVLEAGEGPLQGHWHGHEFHYATTVRATGRPLFRARDSRGCDLGAMGLCHGTVMGSFAHLIERG